jgi:predicted metal-binding membrane protein
MLRTRPEHLALALGLAAWLLMLVQAASARGLSCAAHDASFAGDLAAWTQMALAMMLPWTTSSLADVARRSYRERRPRAVVGYLLGYAAGWMALGALLVPLLRSALGRDARAATVLCALAAAWALLPAHERWFALCHRRIALCPVGWRADRDAVRQGLAQGLPCVASCWPLMAACAAVHHHLVMMAACTALVAFEKRMFRLERAPLALGALGIAAWTCTL